jgi:hypothetical protein
MMMKMRRTGVMMNRIGFLYGVGGNGSTVGGSSVESEAYMISKDRCIEISHRAGRAMMTMMSVSVNRNFWE